MDRLRSSNVDYLSRPISDIQLSLAIYSNGFLGSFCTPLNDPTRVSQEVDLTNPPPIINVGGQPHYRCDSIFCETNGLPKDRRLQQAVKKAERRNRIFQREP